MSLSLSTLDLRPRAPRLAGLAVASVVLLLGAACSSGVDAADGEPSLGADEGSGELAAASGDRPDSLVVAVGPSVGAVEAAIEEDVTPPGLVVFPAEPASGVADGTVVFEGFSEPGAVVAAGEISTVAADSGRWSLELVLAEGEDSAVVTTKDAAGNEFHKEVTVNFEKPAPVVYEPPKKEHEPALETKPDTKPEYEPKPEATPKKEQHHEFTAWTKFGICTTEPFEKTGGEGSKETDVLTKFKGNGIPGTAVTVISPYGGGIVEVDDSGYWWIKIEFSDGAAQDEFTAIVTSGDDKAWFHCGAI